MADPSELRAVLPWLLGGHSSSVGLVWLVGVAGDPGPWLPAWDGFLRRLNERREILRQALRCGLVLVGPPGLLPVARDAAPDLWSYRSMLIQLPTGPVRVPEAPGDAERLPAPDDEHQAFAELALLPPIEPSAQLRPLLRQASAELQAGRGDRAVERALEALEAATTLDDKSLAHAWLARGYDLRGDVISALTHAEQALATGRPLGLTMAGRLLEILARSPDPDRVQEAVHRRLAISRRLVDRYGETPKSLRDLSLSLNKAGDVAVARRELGAAAAAYGESLELARRIVERYGETPESLRDLSVSLDRVGDGARARGELDAAAGAYGESLELARRTLEHHGETPESLRDLVVSLNKVGDAAQIRGDPDAAAAAYCDSLELARRIVERYGETPESLRDLSASLDRVGDGARARGELDAAAAAYGESLELARRILERYGETPESLRDLSVSLTRMGDVAQQQGDVARALEAYADALTWYERLDRSLGEPHAHPEELAALRATVDRLRAQIGNNSGELSTLQ